MLMLIVIFAAVHNFDQMKVEAKSDPSINIEPEMIEIVDSNYRQGRRRPVSLTEYWAYKEKKRLAEIEEKRNRAKIRTKKPPAVANSIKRRIGSTQRRPNIRRKYVHKHKHCYYA